MEEIRYRREQELIMNYTGGKMAIPAVPGGGKTFILSRLAAKLVKELEGEEEILILTYMNSSVNNFKHRIMELLQKRDEYELYRKFQIKTIHKLGSDLLREHGDSVGITEGFQTMTDANKYYLMSLVVMNYRREKPGDLDSFLDAKYGGTGIQVRWDKELVNLTLKMIGVMKNKGMTAKRLYSRSKKYRKDSLLRVVGELFYRYDLECKKDGLLDYDDILFYTYKLLKQTPVLTEELKLKYRYIFEDEAQDSNTLQNKIINLIFNGNLVKVGDPNQSILGTFTSSSPEIFKKFIRSNPKVEMFTAGRSTRGIIEVANYLVEIVTMRHPLEKVRTALQPQFIKPVLEGEIPSNPKIDGYGVKTIKVLGWEEEKDRLIRGIEGFIKKYPEKSVGILLPTNYRIDEIARIFRRKKIDFQILSDIPESLLELMNFLGDFLEYLARPFENKRLVKLLEDNFFVDDEREVREIISKFIRSNLLEDVLYGEGNPRLDKFSLKKYKAILKKIRAVLDLNQSSLEKVIVFIGEIFEIHDEKRLLIEKISYDLKKILKYNPKWSLLDLASNLKKAKNSEFSYMAKAVEEEGVLENKEKFKVTLSSYHRSKGMEWDFVYLAGVDNRTFPVHLNETNYGQCYYLKKEYEYPQIFTEKEFVREFVDRNTEIGVVNNKLEKIAENTRLLYVGITRAREYLMISGNAENGVYYLGEIEKFVKSRVNS
ncbi:MULTISPECIES: UvrD-helicase domain-containing protein [Psychrilyobacter]|uniref:DNA 3'-5' helicase n=1 Tax=Psychrilyobacter piezotolerans TaxID=2293438 RepID=A0ABX9KH76_9FUSO|nr:MULTISPECIES: ATP-dependent helicase [Psychrilyobacter]MCS5422531.1 ATP-dependent helicase [Psychrilyobacter sp. S5]NDI77958.1 ATP-dependent helicase [Psychrilyobacter piezotolerans]RDE62073.1 ATP-dependent helicase [Psychrilyobacter sp. S5]REI41320.1 ATP-dependent helicase [Psychrilyobacter piezotolerans]